MARQYRGVWCALTDSGSILKRCGERRGEEDWEISAREFDNGEVGCKVLTVTTTARRGHVVRASCQYANEHGNVGDPYLLSERGG
jgi:hypothetical protein